MDADMDFSESHRLERDSVLSLDCPRLSYPLPTSPSATDKSRFNFRNPLMKGIANRFNRRKSSGNVLELANPPASGESSFRVLPRPESTYDNDRSLKRPPPTRPRTSPTNSPQRRPYSYFGDGSDLSSNRGSGNTNNSNATTVDSAKRGSYASTEASSVDDSLDDQGDLPFQPRQKYTPIAPVNSQPSEPEPQSRKTFSLKNAGRAFSFGAKSAKTISKPSEDVPPIPNRDRSMTTSSYASTATPPKLDLGTGTGLGLGESEFSDMFKRKSTIMEESASPSQPTPQHSSYAYNQADEQSTHSPPRITSTYLNYQGPNETPRGNRPTGPCSSRHDTPSTDGRFAASSPTNLDVYPPRNIGLDRTGSPYSFRSGASEERLMSSPRQQAQPESPNFGSSFGASGDPSVIGTLMAHYAQENDQQSPRPPRHIPESNPLPRSKPTRQPPTSYRGPEPTRRSPLSEGFQTANLSRGAPSADESKDEESMFDSPRPRRYLRPHSRTLTAPALGGGKVMTPAEFEKYKKHKENEPPEANGDESDESSDSETYEDEDETERQKEAAKARRKQEAHLAVYRQQMMKVTGEQPADLPSVPQRVPLERSSASAPSLHGALPFEAKAQGASQASKSSHDDDEDEEVPLGVLQAHGFPHKNRAPTRTSSSTPNLQSASYPAPGGTTRNDSAAGGGGNPNLPVFAKNLPQDPYVGASLVNPPTRESMAFNSAGSTPSPPSHQQAPPQSGGGNLPPGGLVGVIASEERAKAMRRGSPNTRGTYDPVPSNQLPHEVQQQQMMQQMMQQQMPPQAMGPYSSGPHTPMSPNEQSQLNMANQMTQMMQMQMQLMQWAMQNQGQMPPGMQMPMGMQSPQNFGQSGFLSADPMAHRMSMASTAASTAGHQRAASNISRGPSPGNRFSTATNGMQSSNGGYTPSIAPSERSVVGQPSRYRPVTSAAGTLEHDSRTSSISQQTVQALQTQRSQSRIRQSTADLPKPAIKNVERPKQSSRDDDDDDAGWAEMQKQRKARQSRWKSTRPQSTMSGYQEGGLEGLLYEGPQA